MRDIQIVVDSTAYLTKDYIDKNNIEVASLSVELDELREKEGLPGNFSNFFDRFERSESFPKTSQPPVGEFAKCFERAFTRGSEIIAITFSSKLSGTYASARLAADMFDGHKITVIDSETAVGNYRAMIYKIVELAENHASKDEIVETVEKMKENMSINLTVESLEYLKRGGRLSNMQAVIGTLLNIKPIISLVDGKLVATDKARGKKKAIELMMSKIPTNVKRISIEHVQNEEEAKKIKELIEAKFEYAEISIDEIGPVIGAHLGPKAIGICSTW